MAGQPLLQVEGVETYYGNIRALNGVNVAVQQGEIVALIGANGAGKSTLMMTIFGSPRARSRHDHALPAKTSPQHADARDRADADRPVAGGPPHLPAHDGARKPADGRQPRQPAIFRRGRGEGVSRCFRA